MQKEAQVPAPRLKHETTATGIETDRQEHVKSVRPLELIVLMQIVTGTLRKEVDQVGRIIAKGAPPRSHFHFESGPHVEDDAANHFGADGSRH